MYQYIGKSGVLVLFIEHGLPSYQYMENIKNSSNLKGFFIVDEFLNVVKISDYYRNFGIQMCNFEVELCV